MAPNDMIHEVCCHGKHKNYIMTIIGACLRTGGANWIQCIEENEYAFERRQLPLMRYHAENYLFRAKFGRVRTMIKIGGALMNWSLIWKSNSKSLITMTWQLTLTICTTRTIGASIKMNCGSDDNPKLSCVAAPSKWFQRGIGMCRENLLPSTLVFWPLLGEFLWRPDQK